MMNFYITVIYGLRMVLYGHINGKNTCIQRVI